SQGVVERTSDDRPALYYANIYITNRDELARLDALLIHWQTKPLFATELPDDLVESCGTVSYEGDGEGMWVFAVLPGATYNALLDARTHPDIPSEEREIFRAVQLRTPPPGTADANGAIEYSVLQDAGFHYMNVAELPDDLALEDAVFPARAGSKIVNAARFVFDKAKTAVREVLTFTGWVDGLFAGTVNIDVNLKLENLDGRFSTPTNLRNPRAVLRA